MLFLCENLSFSCPKTAVNLDILFECSLKLQIILSKWHPSARFVSNSWNIEALNAIQPNFPQYTCMFFVFFLEQDEDDYSSVLMHPKRASGYTAPAAVLNEVAEQAEHVSSSCSKW